MSGLPICTKLRATETGYVNEVPYLINPDGPEAADTIEALYEALEDLAERMIGAFPSLADTPEVKRAQAALARARSEHPSEGGR